MNQIRVQMRLLDLCPAFDKERFLEVKLQAVQRSLARFSEVFGEAFGFEFREVFFDLFVHIRLRFVYKSDSVTPLSARLTGKGAVCNFGNKTQPFFLLHLARLQT